MTIWFFEVYFPGILRVEHRTTQIDPLVSIHFDPTSGLVALYRMQPDRHNPSNYSTKKLLLLTTYMDHTKLCYPKQLPSPLRIACVLYSPHGLLRVSVHFGDHAVSSSYTTVDSDSIIYHSIHKNPQNDLLCS